ncbi:hypothetical protein Pla110_38230 [Polystyrenella longa]|uniref:Uncharacterized protein n=1 Tax=Polystyrenella longa TaxID=2528007 RepID=A0A518CS74_9PLAN|nr:hypothetical protein [Polystyrenella longa]QDU82068.1 hypothetical protein Pla110_38230 [Polystyrenella longa]
MTHLSKMFLTLALIGVGYGMGLAHQNLISEVRAQGPSRTEGVSTESLTRIRNSYATLADVQKDLVASGRQEVGLSVVNVLAIGAGGTRTLEDLERGTGVDPFTFGALYAGLADPSIRSEVSFDEDNRLMYRGKALRLYSPERMKKLFKDFEAITAGN